MVMRDHLNVITKKELKNTYGGVSVTASLIEYATKAITTIFDMGRGFGSSIRRIKNNELCKISKTN